MAQFAGLVTNLPTARREVGAPADQRAQICVLRCTSPRHCADGLFLGWTPDGQVWIASAKRPETRERMIAQTVELATRNVRASQPSARRATGG